MLTASVQSVYSLPIGTCSFKGSTIIIVERCYQSNWCLRSYHITPINIRSPAMPVAIKKYINSIISILI